MPERPEITRREFYTRQGARVAIEYDHDAHDSHEWMAIAEAIEVLERDFFTEDHNVPAGYPGSMSRFWCWVDGFLRDFPTQTPSARDIMLKHWKSDAKPREITDKTRYAFYLRDVNARENQGARQTYWWDHEVPLTGFGRTRKFVIERNNTEAK